MNPSLIFGVAAALVVVGVLALLLPPLLRGAPKNDSPRVGNVDVYRDQIAELERERDEGALGAADFAQAKAELQRRLLEEVGPADLPSATLAPAGARKSAAALLLTLPLAAVAGYLLLGTPEAINPAAQDAASSQHASNKEIDAMLVKLAQRLKENPGDAKGWVMLARSYKSLGRYAEAAEAFAGGAALVDNDASLLAEYAEVLAETQGGRYDGKPDALLARALKLDPSALQVLFVAGVSASSHRDYAGAVRYWEELVPQLTPGSVDAETIGAALAEARELAGKQPPPQALARAEPARAAVAAGSAKTDAASGRQEAIRGEVSISGKVAARANADDVLFIFARNPEASRMPLAVIRTQVADLPLKFEFDDTMALPGGQKISDLAAVSLEARVAKAGKAQSSPGDLFGVAERVKPGSAGVKIVIDQVQP